MHVVKTLATFLALGYLHVCCFGGETNIIAATDWSQPVGSGESVIRGRLLLMRGNEPAYGGPKTENLTMTFIELQNVTGACCGSSKVYFDVSRLTCELVDSAGKSVSLYRGGRGGGLIAEDFASTWAILPYNSTIRLFVTAGTVSPFTIRQNGIEYWALSPSDTNAYYWSGTLTISTPTNTTLTVTPHDTKQSHDHVPWTGTLVFPKVKLSVPKP